MFAWLLVYTFPAERTKQAACLMHECLPSKLPNFDWNTKWAHWPPKDFGPWRLLRIQSLTSSWQDSLPTGLRLHYKAADNSKAAAKCPHRQQWHACFYSFFFLLTSYNPHTPTFPSIIFRGYGCVPWCSEKALWWLHSCPTISWNNDSVGKCSSAIFPSCLRDQNNKSDITPLCPFLQKPCTEDALLCTSPAVTHTDIPEPSRAPCKAVLSLVRIYIYALMDWHSLYSKELKYKWQNKKDKRISCVMSCHTMLQQQSEQFKS